MAEAVGASSLPDYAELHCLSSFSFQRGASQPEELVERAVALGYRALAITDECSLAGVVRAHARLQELRAERARALAAQRDPSGYVVTADSIEPDLLNLIIGSEFVLDFGARLSATSGTALDETATGSIPWRLIALARNRKGYAQLSRFITRLRRESSEKGNYHLPVELFDEAEPQPDAVHHVSANSIAGAAVASLADCALLLAPARPCSEADLHGGVAWGRAHFGERLWLAVEQLLTLDDAAWLARLREAGARHGVPLVAAGDVHMHVRSRKPLHDVLTAVRLGRPVDECGLALHPHAERHLRSRTRLAQVYPADLLAATLQLADECRFSLNELRYEYPDEVVPAGHTAASFLRQCTFDGARDRYPGGIPEKVMQQIETELALISELEYEKYFLTVYDIVRFARKDAGILCQGRGSAANSAVCYCLHITEVDPERISLLFERFISRERHEPPDIDVDFEHQRREEVIQYLFNKYGRDRTALAATVITYRTRSAVRDVGKALGFSLEVVDALAKSHQWWESRAALVERMVELGLDADNPRLQHWFTLTEQLVGMPRHLSQHVGGFVIAKGLLSELVPIENATMPDRCVIQWDKDDLEALCLMKVDVLALGMLSAIRRALDFIGARRGAPFRMQDIPSEDPATYDMIRRADTVGTFQIESRAQMSMLPRLRPEAFYDLVVQVAIVRPGPIQGGMVQPFLRGRAARRRDENWQPSYPKALKRALDRTLGVPIFQEQVMQIVMDGAGFTAGEADQLRRAMATWKRKGGLEPFRDRIIHGLTITTDRAFADSIFEMIKGFGAYGFPESHAASFALLAYVSAWLKRHEPAAFLAALLNSAPMGFYSASQLVQDARRHGVEVRPVDVSFSAEQTTLEDAEATLPTKPGTRVDAHVMPQPAVRLGLDHVMGLGAASATSIMRARQAEPFSNVEDLARRAGLDQSALRALASADALVSLAGHRRQQVWQASALRALPVLLRDAPVLEPDLSLAPAPEGEEILFDYAATRLTLRRHPLALLRPRLSQRRLQPAAELHRCPDEQWVGACGIVTMRQQPQTAKGTIFLSLEDETGSVNVIVSPALRERQRAELLQSRLMAVYGVWQHQGETVRHLVAKRLVNLTPLLGRLATSSRDFH
jgi:error-prone DNA polymerase